MLMKKLFLTLLLCVSAQAMPKIGVIDEAFLRRLDEPGANPAIVLVHGQYHQYIKLWKRTVRIDGKNYTIIRVSLTNYGRFWRIRLVYK